MFVRAVELDSTMMWTTITYHPRGRAVRCPVLVFSNKWVGRTFPCINGWRGRGFNIICHHLDCFIEYLCSSLCDESIKPWRRFKKELITGIQLVDPQPSSQVRHVLLYPME